MKLTVVSASKPKTKWGLRHVITTMGLVAGALRAIQASNLSLSITEMVRYQPTEKKIDTEACPYVNSTTMKIKSAGEFDWDEVTQGMILSSINWSYTIMAIPGGLLHERWGAKRVLGGSIFLLSACTLLTPLVSRVFGSWGLISLRFIQGFSEALISPPLCGMLSNWTSADERGKSTAFVFAGSHLGNFLCLASSGFIISYFGWTGVFYTFGAAGIVWTIVWWIIYNDTPLEHPFISEDERTYITTASRKACNKNLPRAPLVPILTSIPIWGLIIANIGHNWCLFTILLDLPKYMKSVLHVSVEKNGVISGLPHLGMWLFCIFIGWVIDLLIVSFGYRGILVKKCFVTLAAVGPALGIIAASYSGCDSTLASGFFIFGMTIMGAYTPGFKSCLLDLSPNYAGCVSALVNVGTGIVAILTPYVIGLLTPNSTLLEWRLVFWISFTAIIGANIAFLVLGSDTTQWWDDPDKVKSYQERKGKRKEQTA